MKRLIASLTLTAALCLTAAHAGAQSRSDSLNLNAKRDLADVLGQVHYIRTLCNGKTDQYWRDFMRDFLELEGGSEDRRSLFVKAFNRGYRQQSRNLDGSCTANAGTQEAALARQGRELAEKIARGYLQ